MPSVLFSEEGKWESTVGQKPTVFDDDDDGSPHHSTASQQTSEKEKLKQLSPESHTAQHSTYINTIFTMSHIQFIHIHCFISR